MTVLRAHCDTRPARLERGRRRPTTPSVSDVPFRFGLERVRELREHDEDRAREELAASIAHQSRGAASLGAVAEGVERARAACRDGALSGASGADLLSHQRWIERLERDRQDAELDLARREAEVDARREALAGARQRREALERLKQRRRAEHDLAGARRAGAQLDEMALAAHVRRGARR
jgi:flagellar FliJ protein